MAVRVQGLEDAAQLKIDIDEAKAGSLGVALADINSTLQTSFGSSYVNNFINGNRVQRVLVQLDAPYRMSPEDIKSDLRPESDWQDGATFRLHDGKMDLWFTCATELQWISFD